MTEESIPKKEPKVKRIFCYGSLRRDEYNHARVNSWVEGEQLVHVADGYIHGAELVDLGEYPCIVAVDDKSKQVVGEVYDVPDALFHLIDVMERSAGYEPVQLDVVSGPSGLEALTYFFSEPEIVASFPRIASGDWSDRSKAA